MTQDTLQIILEIVTVLIGLYLALFKSYFQEKGKNLATKEDIEDITKKIEKVKSDIGILTHKKINLSTEKQNSLLDFNGKYAAWLNYILHTTIAGNAETCTIDISKTQEKLNQLFYDLSVAEARIDVYFVLDTELISLKDKIKLKAIQLSNHLEEHLLLAGGEAAQINIINTLPNVIPDNSYKMGKLEYHYKKRNGINKDYQEKKLEKLKILSPLNHQLDLIISNRIHDFEQQ